MESSPSINDFVVSDIKCKAFEGRDGQDVLLQWNLDKSLSVHSFRIIGPLDASRLDLLAFLRTFFSNPSVLRALQISGAPPATMDVAFTPLSVGVRSTAFFDKLTAEGITSASGTIRGCMEENYHGFMVGDLLREMLLNEDSEHAGAFTTAERNELIFQIFRLLAIGGPMCQPEDKIDRYISYTKNFYKDLVTIYKTSDKQEVKISTRAARVDSVAGGALDLFDGSSSDMNTCLVLIDPLRRLVTVVRTSLKSFW